MFGTRTIVAKARLPTFSLVRAKCVPGVFVDRDLIDGSATYGGPWEGMSATFEGPIENNPGPDPVLGSDPGPLQASDRPLIDLDIPGYLDERQQPLAELNLGRQWKTEENISKEVAAPRGDSLEQFVSSPRDDQ